MDQQRYSLLIVFGVIVVILVVGGIVLYFYWQDQQQTQQIQQQQAVETVGEVSRAVEEISTVPTEINVPETNPVEKVNPFSKTYKNPFE